MNQATDGTHLWRPRPRAMTLTTGAAVLAATIAITALTSGPAAKDAVAIAQSRTASEAPTTVNGPTGYFPDQFVNRASEITAHIEAF